MNQMNNLVLPIFIIWFVTLCITLLKVREIKPFLKLAGISIFCFYFLWFSPEILRSYSLYKVNFWKEFALFFKTLIDLYSLFLILLWPIALVYITVQLGREKELSTSLFLFLTIFTSIYWIIWVAAYIFGVVSVNNFLEILIKISKPPTA